MTTAELIANVLARMQEVDGQVAARARERPINAEDYKALWQGIAFELAIADDAE